MKRQKEKVIIYNVQGKKDRLATFIYNNDWLFIPALIAAIFLSGLFD